MTVRVGHKGGSGVADILIKHLVKRFGKVEAVGDVSLQIADGEFLVLLGPVGVRQEHDPARRRRASRTPTRARS